MAMQLRGDGSELPVAGGRSQRAPRPRPRAVHPAQRVPAAASGNVSDEPSAACTGRSVLSVLNSSYRSRPSKKRSSSSGGRATIGSPPMSVQARDAVPTAAAEVAQSERRSRASHPDID
jgi:hypothetical protein